jgi:hypothetical protein
MLEGAKIYTPMAGGIGDYILTMLTPGFDYGYFEDLKTVGALTWLHLWVVTDSSRDLFMAAPYVDRLDWEDFNRMWEADSDQRAKNDGYRRLTGEEKNALTWRRPEWVLNDTEREHLETILKDQRPFVAFHPFAGDDHRTFRSNGIEPEEAARAMCEAGVRVVVYGGNSLRWAPQGDKLDKHDQFEMFEHENLIDLRGQGSVRLQAHLMQFAKAFVGGTSWANCAAEAYGVPSLVFTTAYNRSHIKRDTGGIFWLMANRPTTRIHYFDQMPEDPIGEIQRFVG